MVEVKNTGEITGRFVDYECYEQLEKENAELKAKLKDCRQDFWKAVRNVGGLRSRIEKMKADVRFNIQWADHEKNHQMWKQLMTMINEWS